MGSDKRPYTSSGNVGTKRNATAGKASQNNSAIAALYMGTKTHQNGFNMGPPGQHRNASQPTQDVHALGYPQGQQPSISMFQIPSKR